jgi:glycosyltransferase involved in cell wall biosynthesis
VRPKHILFIVENNSVPFDPRVWNEARAARAFGYDVTVICPSDARAKDIRPVIEGIRIYRHPQLPEGPGKLRLIVEYLNAALWEMWLSLRIYLDHPFDVIHGANPPDHLFLIALPFRVLGVKYLFDHHDIAPENYQAKFGKKGLMHAILLWMERMTFRSADLVVSTNDSYRAIAIDRGGKDPKDVVVVRNGPDLSRSAGVLPDPELRAGFRHLVGYVGVIGEQEGLENLLQAVEFIVGEKKRTDIKFMIVGSGPFLKSLVERSRERGLERYVHFTGFVPVRTLHTILASSDVCVNPEKGNEFTDRSTMIKIMEYMMFSKPIVQFHTKEGEVTAGGAALYVRELSAEKLAEAILSLLDDPDRREQMGSLGRRRIEDRLEWGKQKAHLADAYRRILKTRPGLDTEGGVG